MNKMRQNIKIHLITMTTVTILPYHIPLVPLTAVNLTTNTRFWSGALLEIKENPFLTIEKSELVLISTLQRLGSQVPDAYMVVLWNPSGQNVIPKWNMTICYVKESEYKEKEKKTPRTTQNLGKPFKDNPQKHLLLQ